MFRSPTNISISEEYFPREEGRTIPKWAEIFERCHWIQGEAGQNEFMQGILLQWALRICEESNEDLQIVRSGNFLAIAATDKRRRKALVKFCESSRKKIVQMLDAVSGGFLPINVVICFESEIEYYNYLSAYYPEGDFAGSAGIFISGGSYPHIAIQSPELESYHTVLAHELTHMAMNHLSLPVWLNEGITQTVEREIAPDVRYHHMESLDLRDLEKKSRTYWNDETIQMFWSGEAFHSNESQEVAYYFARVLFYLLFREVAGSKAQMAEFVTNTNRDDAGEASFNRTFKASLNDLIEEILGEGEWAPRPRMWSTWDSD